MGPSKTLGWFSLAGLLLYLSFGCSEYVYPSEWVRAVEICESNEGVRHIDVQVGSNKVTCNNGVSVLPTYYYEDGILPRSKWAGRGIDLQQQEDGE